MTARARGRAGTLARVSEACGDDVIGCGLDATPSIAIDGPARRRWRGRGRRHGRPGHGNHPGLWHAAERADGSWSTELAVAVDDGVASPDLAIGPDEAAHIAYARYDAGNEGVYEATNESGSWVARSWRRSIPASTSVGRGSP